jgi:hypothetical protein
MNPYAQVTDLKINSIEEQLASCKYSAVVYGFNTF